MCWFDLAAIAACTNEAEVAAELVSRDFKRPPTTRERERRKIYKAQTRETQQVRLDKEEAQKVMFVSNSHIGELV